MGTFILTVLTTQVLTLFQICGVEIYKSDDETPVPNDLFPNLNDETVSFLVVVVVFLLLSLILLGPLL